MYIVYCILCCDSIPKIAFSSKTVPRSDKISAMVIPYGVTHFWLCAKNHISIWNCLYSMPYLDSMPKTTPKASACQHLVIPGGITHFWHCAKNCAEDIGMKYHHVGGHFPALVPCTTQKSGAKTLHFTHRVWFDLHRHILISEKSEKLSGNHSIWSRF